LASAAGSARGQGTGPGFSPGSDQAALSVCTFSYFVSLCRADGQRDPVWYIFELFTPLMIVSLLICARATDGMMQRLGYGPDGRRISARAIEP
jgi:hypothetical protein